MEKLTDSELDQLAQLADAATPGPWAMESLFVTATDLSNGTIAKVKIDKSNDAAFIAASRSAVPALVAEVRKLQSEVERLKSVAAYYEVQF